MTAVVGDLSRHHTVRQGKTCLAERTHRRNIAVALAVTRHGIGIVRTQLHGVILVGEGRQRLVHRHLRHEGDSHAVPAQRTRDGEVRKIVLILRYRPLEAYAVVAVAFGSRERRDDCLTRRCHTDRRTGQRAYGARRRADLHRVFDRLAGRDAFGQLYGSKIAIRIFLAVGRTAHHILHAVEHIRGPHTFVVAYEVPAHLYLTAYILCGYRREFSEVGIDENILLDASARMIHKLAAQAHVERLAPLVEHFHRDGQTYLV